MRVRWTFFLQDGSTATVMTACGASTEQAIVSAGCALRDVRDFVKAIVR